MTLVNGAQLVTRGKTRVTCASEARHARTVRCSVFIIQTKRKYKQILEKKIFVTTIIERTLKKKTAHTMNIFHSKMMKTTQQAKKTM